MTLRFLDKLLHLMSHDFGVMNSEQVRNPPVYGAQSAIQRNGKGDVIDGVDQFLEATL